MSASPAYPFTPKSNAYLRRGQYFAIPLSNGQTCAGVVLGIAVADDPHALSGRRGFVAGLLDWVGDSSPTSTDLTGRALLDWGYAHIKVITEFGTGEVLGICGAEIGSTPSLRVSHRAGGTVWLYDRGQRLRPATLDEARELPVASTYGHRFLRVLGERVLVRGEPIIH